MEDAERRLARRDQADSDALDCIGFRTVFARSVEWAATQKVTIPVPANFPTADALSIDRRPGAPTQSPVDAR